MNIFFKKKNNITFNKILSLLNVKNEFKIKNFLLNDIKTLNSSNNKDISFFNSSKYKNDLNKTKAKIIICNKIHLKLIPKKSIPLVVNNVLLSVSKVTNLFYPDAINDDLDHDVDFLNKKNNFINLSFGKNVLIGKRVKIGKNSSIGHNSIIETNVTIGNNCSIGSNVIIRKSIIGNNVNILDGAIIGKKGFGFFPTRDKNYRYPHIGAVIIGNDVEIGCNNTIDRGSLSNTVIGDNSFLDNQVHIAHNVKIGKNCVITGQVGFAGSSEIGNFVMIGGQAGISGHLKIGNNVQIGGGSGVVKSIPNNSKVMGYPAKDIRNFLKENK
tara:strand:- start:1572 stop:2549 length:978 start_codon:yes stop_codon:yes gene_type:complete